MHRAKPNEQVLADARIAITDKNKIKEIGHYKKYFYSFFKKESTDIYEKTFILDRSAVSFSVISSPYDELKAIQECFPVVGCFPYLAFFNQEKARNYQKKKEAENLITYLGPIYAYSTLGHFTDPILSSFFHYQSEDLAELIFHELFHTVFFIKNEVELNENLASFFAHAMKQEYFKKEADPLLPDLFLEVAQKAQELNILYKHNKEKLGVLSKEQAQKILDHFLMTSFYPHIKSVCTKYQINEKECFPLSKRQIWNNAHFVQFLTYAKDTNWISALKQQQNLDLPRFLQYLEGKYTEYKKNKKKSSFAHYLRQEVKEGMYATHISP